MAQKIYTPTMFGVTDGIPNVMLLKSFDDRQKAIEFALNLANEVGIDDHPNTVELFKMSAGVPLKLNLDDTYISVEYTIL